MKDLCAIIALLFSANASAESTSLLKAAKKFVPGVAWRSSSAVTGDFTCNGRTTHAILGSRENEMFVAIFVRGLSRRPQVLSYAGGPRDPEKSSLSVEDLDFDPVQFEKDVGYIPKGLIPSKTCKGINLSDGLVDSAHIYYERKTKKFWDWSL